MRQGDDIPLTPERGQRPATAPNGVSSTEDSWAEAARAARERGFQDEEGEGEDAWRGWRSRRRDGEEDSRNGNKYFPKVTFKEFTGDVSMYKEWKREIELLTILHEIEEVRVAGLLYLALAPGPGKPRDLFGHWQIPADLQTEHVLKMMWQGLDAE